MTKDSRKLFITDLNPVDIFSILGLIIVFVSALFFVWGRPETAFGFMFTALLFDAFDGVLARKLGTERSFGRYLDGFIDAMSYVVLPGIFLYTWGFNAPYALAAFACFAISALVRLSVFNEIGNIKENGKLSYLGMPVFWMHFLCAAFYFSGIVMKDKELVFPAAAAVLVVYSFLMVLNRNFYKPSNKIMMLAVVVSLAAVFFRMGCVK